MASAAQRKGKVTTMTPQTTENKIAASNKLVAKKKVFDLDKFEKVSKEVEYEKPAPLTSMDEVLNLDEKKVLAIVNLGLARQAWKEARNSIAGVSPKIINQFVNVWRMLPPYSQMVETDETGATTKDSRRKQTQAIYSFIKSQEQILESLKAAAASSTDEDEEDETEEQD